MRQLRLGVAYNKKCQNLVCLTSKQACNHHAGHHSTVVTWTVASVIVALILYIGTTTSPGSVLLITPDIIIRINTIANVDITNIESI